MTGQEKTMYDLIIAIQYISILGLFIESWIIFRKWNSKLHAYLLFGSVANLINNIGYLFELKARTQEAYIAALQLSYFGRVWIAFALFLFAAELCRVKLSDVLKIGLALCHVAVYVVVLTVPSNDLYYKDIHFEMNGDFPNLIFSSGIVHYMFTIMLILYVVVGMTIMFVIIHRERNKNAKKRMQTVIIAMIIESIFVLIQRFRLLDVCDDYDVSMLGFTLGTMFMLFAIFRYRLLDTEQLAKAYIVDKLSEGIIAADRNGTVAYYNKPAGQLFPELDRNPGEVLEKLNKAIENSETLLLNEHIYTPATDTLNSGENELATVYVIQDHTEFYKHASELEKMTERANAANEAKSAFLSNMSHEIRTPINAVLGMDEMILRESRDADIIAYAEDIRTAGRTLLSLINEILDLSKIEEGRMEIIPAQYELHTLVNDLVNMIRDRAEQKGLCFEVEIDGNIPYLLCGDEIRIKQCAVNLLTNAVKYTEKGSVRLSVGYTEKDSGHILLTFAVKDTGIGMKPEDMENLFAPFARLEEKRNRKIEGTGLGISITEQLLELMGSRLEVRSVYGEGSEFSFTILQEVMKNEPMGDYAERCGSENRHTAYTEMLRAPGARILVVDDTPVNLSVVRGLLKQTQVGIDTAGSGMEAVAKASDNSYDIIFLDHMMPEMDGIQTLHEIRRLPRHKDTVCVALTANAISGAHEMYLKEGFSDYLSKPVEGEKLEQILVRYLPMDKIQSGQPDKAAEEYASEEETALPSGLDDIDEISTAQGIKYCGSAKLYLDTLTYFANAAAKNAAEIENLWKAGDLEGTTIKVHALKSTARLIGAENLSGFAKRLEDAGKNNDSETVGAEIDSLLERYRSLGVKLSAATENLVDDAEKPPMTEEMLQGIYSDIREAAEYCDIGKLMTAIDELSAHRIPDNEKERCKQLTEAAEVLEWDAVGRLVGIK